MVYPEFLMIEICGAWFLGTDKMLDLILGREKNVLYDRSNVDVKQYHMYFRLIWCILHNLTITFTQILVSSIER